MLKIWYELYIWTEKSDYKIIKILGTLAFVLGLVIYKFVYDLPFLESIIYSTQLFAMDVKTPFELKEFLVDLHSENALCNLNGELNRSKSFASFWWLIYLASLIATLTLVTTIALLLFRNRISTFYLERLIKEGSHTIVIGLGRNSRFFINSLLETEKHKVIVFERDKENAHINKYKNKEIAVVTRDVDNMLNGLNMENAKQIFISTGNDEQNIYLALQVISFFEDIEAEHTLKKLMVHVENRTLRNLYADKGVLDCKSIDIRLFSYYKEAARLLFKEHPLDGDHLDIINGTKDINIVLVGNSELTISVISEVCRLAHFPNENKVHIHCLDKDAALLKSKVLYAFPKIEKIASVNINYLSFDKDSIDFYDHGVWESDNLKHVILTDESVVENIIVTTKLKSIPFLGQTERETKFHVATMNHIKLEKKLKSFNGEDGNIFSFAQANLICTKKNLMEGEIDNMAKMIDYAYKSHKHRNHAIKIPSEKELMKNWKLSSINDKRASVAQAIHLDTKLKTLNLEKVKVKEFNQDALLQENKKVLNAALASDLEKIGLTAEYKKNLEELYKNRKEGVTKTFFFPEEYALTFEKILRMEHNRWMAVLLLMDNTYDEKAKVMTSSQRKALKVHHLLQPFSKFTELDEKIYIINDINAILNMPEYLMLRKYKLKKIVKEVNK